MTVTPELRDFLESETSGMLTIPANRTPRGYEQLTSLSAAVSLSPPTGARIALLQAEDQNVRWRDDATEPTAAVGVRMVTDEVYLYTGDLAAVTFIQEAAVAKLNVVYYG